MSIAATDSAERRRRAIEDARVSSELEGSRNTDATRADKDAFVRGEIDVNQLGQRVRALRRGLSDPRPWTRCPRAASRKTPVFQEKASAPGKRALAPASSVREDVSPQIEDAVDLGGIDEGVEGGLGPFTAHRVA